MRILAFDLGRTTGWAVLEDGKIFAGSYRASGDDEPSIFRDWERFMARRIEWAAPDAIAYEDVTFNRGKSYIPGMKALLFVGAPHDVTCFGVPVQTLKKFASNWTTDEKWTGSKSNMANALQFLRGDLTVSGMTEDEVDASWIAIWFDETAVESDPAEGIIVPSGEGT